MLIAIVSIVVIIAYFLIGVIVSVSTRYCFKFYVDGDGDDTKLQFVIFWPIVLFAGVVAIVPFLCKLIIDKVEERLG